MWSLSSGLTGSKCDSLTPEGEIEVCGAEGSCKEVGLGPVGGATGSCREDVKVESAGEIPAGGIGKEDMPGGGTVLS